MSNVESIELIRLLISKKKIKDDSCIVKNINAEKIKIGYSDAINLISSLNYDDIRNLFNSNINENIDYFTKLAYISFYDYDFHKKVFPDKNENIDANKKIAIFWECNLIDYPFEKLVELKYINSILNSNIIQSVGMHISQSNKQSFRVQLSDFRYNISRISKNGFFVRAYIGDLNSDIDDNSLDSANFANIISIKNTVDMLYEVFLVSQSLLTKKPIIFDDGDDMSNFLIDLTESISQISSISNEGYSLVGVELNNYDKHIISRFIEGTIKTDYDFTKLVNISIENDSNEIDVKKPSFFCRLKNILIGKHKKVKNNRKVSKDLTFDDLVIDSQPSSGGKLKNYFIEFMLIILIIFSFVGYLFKYTTLNGIVEYSVDNEYSYEDSTGVQKTKITIDRVSGGEN